MIDKINLGNLEQKSGATHSCIAPDFVLLLICDNYP